MTSFNTLKTILLSIQIVLSVFVVFLNGLFIISLVKTGSLHTPSNAVLGCLCCSDLLIGTLSILFWIFSIVSYYGNRWINFEMLTALFHGYMTCAGLSTLFMILVTFDRYAAICHPYKYLQYVTSKLYAIISVCAFSAYVLVIALTYILDGVKSTLPRDVFYAIIVAAATIILIYCNWKILRVIRRHRREIASVERHINEQQSEFQSEKNRYYIILLLIVIFFFCTAPRVVWSFQFQNSNSSVSFILGFIVSCIILLLNSLLNPIVYYFRITLFRNAIIELFCCRWLG